MCKPLKELFTRDPFFLFLCDGTERKGHRWTSLSDCSHANVVPASHDEEGAELSGGKLSIYHSIYIPALIYSHKLSLRPKEWYCA